jgi:plasmid replication initiation protein
MTEIISEKELLDTLNLFRHVLIDYDYSEVSNVVFLNVESLNTYMDTHEDNPFHRQYKDLEVLFNKIIPFIPSNIPDEAIEAITNILESKYHNDRDMVKNNILFNIKMDFIETVKNISNENEWKELMSLCKSIREAKVHHLTH